jgi:hypothetical protein
MTLEGLSIFGIKGYMSVVEFFEQKTISKKTLDKINDADTSDFPVSFEKQTSKTIWSWSLSKAQLRYGLPDLRFLRDTANGNIFFL